MTQPSLLDVPADAATLMHAVARLMLDSRGRWVSAYELQRVGGEWAWRTRLSEARRRYQFKTQHRMQPLSSHAGTGRARVSQYRVVP